VPRQLLPAEFSPVLSWALFLEPSATMSANQFWFFKTTVVNLGGINRYFYLKGYGCFRLCSTAFLLLKLGDVSCMENTEFKDIDLTQ